MKRSLLPIIGVAVLACLAGQAAARSRNHVWPPPQKDIQAVCRIETKRGPDIEGIVLLGVGYECNCLRYLDANGFLFMHKDSSSSPILFDRYYREIFSGKIPDDEYWTSLGRREHLPSVVEWPEHERVYFLYARPNEQYVRSRVYLSPETISIVDSIDSGANPLVFTRDIVEHFPVQYELLDHIPVYPRIPDEVAVRGAKSISPRRIPLRDIKSFRILMRLSERWVRDITVAKDRASKRGANVLWLNTSTVGEILEFYSPWENYPLEYTGIGMQPFDMQAICRIETTDSQTVTGAILIASGVAPNLLENPAETNGFLFLRNEPRMLGDRRWDEIYLFPFSSPGMAGMARGEYISWMALSSCGRKSSQGWPLDAREYYLRDVTVQRLGKSRFRTVETEFVREGKSLVLRRDVVNRYPNIFEMWDCIPVYTELPEDGSLRDAVSIQPTCIPMSKIQKFDIVADPPEIWWIRIERSAQKRPLYQRSGPTPIMWLLGYEDYLWRQSTRHLKPWDAVGFERFHKKLDYTHYRVW